MIFHVVCWRIGDAPDVCRVNRGGPSITGIVALKLVFFSAEAVPTAASVASWFRTSVIALRFVCSGRISNKHARRVYLKGNAGMLFWGGWWWGEGQIKAKLWSGLLFFLATTSNNHRLFIGFFISGWQSKQIHINEFLSTYGNQTRNIYDLLGR